MSTFPQDVRDFGQWFVFMQGQRQQADYSPNETFARDRVLQLINESEDAIIALENVATSDRRAFALHVLLRRQRG